MKTKMSKRVLTLVLAIVLTFALGVSAFATWSSFQHNKENNGTINANATPPISANPTIVPPQLSVSGTLFSGIDTTPVIQGNNAYVVYNGGEVNGTSGGARLARVDITSTNPNTATVWDIQLDNQANNAQQLSTPYYDSSANAVYAGVTYDVNRLSGKTLNNWTSSAISGGVLTIPADTTVTLTYSGLNIPGAYSQAYFMTGITPASGTGMSGTVTLVNDESGATYNYGTSYSYAGYEFGLYNNSGLTVPSGSYNVTITLTSTATVTSTAPITCIVSYWKLYRVTDLTNSTPTVNPITNGAGQISTPINTGSGYLYFGVYEGDRCYYQVNPSTGDKVSFKPTGGEDFYWAGAARVGDYMVFGSESGKVYKRPIGTGFGTGTGAVLDLNTADTSVTTNPGKVRSSVCYDGSNLYLTTNNGYLWKMDTAITTQSAIAINLQDSTYVSACSSTPVVSANNYIYVGGYKTVYNTSTWTTEYYGEVYAIPVSSFTQASLQSLWVSNTEAVQSSVVTFSTTNPSTGTAVDYLYFTTNCANGKGYCLSYAPGSTTSSTVWTAGSGYTVQGMAAADNGTIVFGNDDNELYIVK